MSYRRDPRCLVFLFRVVCVCTLALLLAGATSSSLYAQGGGGGTGGGGTGGGDDTIGTGLTSGVAIDADGVLRRLTINDTNRQLAQERARQAQVQLGGDLAKRSPLRKVSLTRLARLVRQAIDEGHGPDEAMKHLAGLTRVRYVFYYPETQDIVLAGPAEAWAESSAGRMLGIETGQPVIELQDLVVALRTFPPQGGSSPFVYCSIDATTEGLSKMRQFLGRVGRQIDPRDDQFIVDGLRESLGMQVISVGGVPATTHFAQVMVEADYRMKLIGIGLERPPVRIKSYVSLASFGSISRNAMQRWYFVPDYQRIRLSEDHMAAELVGRGVKLVGEDELVSGDGSRQQLGSQNRASRQFTNSFTDKYGQLADQAPVYGQLRNCIDLLVAAAFIQKHDLYSQAGWDLQVLGDESIYPVETYNAPKQVASAVNRVWKGNRLATPIGGGVEIRAQLALDSANVLADSQGEVAAAHEEADLSTLPDDQWWWD